MHRIPPFFSHSSKGRAALDSKQRQKKPKLKRQNAGKNIEYQPPPSLSSLSSSSSETSSSLRSRSLDVLPLACRTSFRVGGNEGDFEDICKELGFSGPGDFEIPAEAWQAMKMRSASDILPRKNQFFDFDNENGSGCSTSSLVSELANRLGGTVRISTETAEDCEIKDFPEGNNGLKPPNPILSTNSQSVDVYPSRGGGINGVKPPPLIALPVLDDACSTWDLLKSLAPDADRCSLQLNLSSYEGEEGESGKRDERIDSGLREAGFLSESCSFTSVDDDTSSTTTERTSNNISPNGRFRRIISYWEKGELLGSGSFGSVYEGIADGGFFFAVKEVSLLDQGDQGRQGIFQLEQEIALLSQFEHENIVQYYGTDKGDSKLYIFLELVTKGSLLKLYQKYTLRDSQVSSYTRQILHGLKYLHDRDVIHRDIKCANILVDASGSVKLADFGLAKATKLNDVKSCKGTALWMAPEVVNLQNQGYGLAADIWSLGCTVLEMLTRQLPYYPLEFMQAVYKIGKGILPPVPDSLSRDARDFILQCLQVNPSSRPSAAKLLNHPFVKRPLPSSYGSPSLYNPGRCN